MTQPLCLPVALLPELQSEALQARVLKRGAQLATLFPSLHARREGFEPPTHRPVIQWRSWPRCSPACTRGARDSSLQPTVLLPSLHAKRERFEPAAYRAAVG